MESNSNDRKKKAYSSPTLTKLTSEEAQNLVAVGKSCSKEEASEFLKSLRRKPQQHEKQRTTAA